MKNEIKSEINLETKLEGKGKPKDPSQIYDYNYPLNCPDQGGYSGGHTLFNRNHPQQERTSPEEKPKYNYSIGNGLL